MNQGHDPLLILLEELRLVGENLLAIVRDQDGDPREVGSPVWPWHRQPQAAAQRSKAPAHVRVRWFAGVRHAAISLHECLRRVLPAKGRRHLDTDGRAGRIALLDQRLLQVLDYDGVASAPHVEREVGHGRGVDVVLVAHVGDDTVPDQWEVRREVCRLLARLLWRERRVVEDLLREALGQLAHGIFVEDTRSRPATLPEDDQDPQHRATQCEPQLGVSEKEEKGHAPHDEPHEKVRPPHRGVAEIPHVGCSLVAEARDLQVFDGRVHYAQDDETDRELHRQNTPPEDVPHDARSA
mmetsp:Transcript_116947/g.337992  ORF Transcript_116947/g.337992 Transcript_116947/m.337992 type:complete len:296 (+) Transcript_116947:675-1562(+)